MLSDLAMSEPKDALVILQNMLKEVSATIQKHAEMLGQDGVTLGALAATVSTEIVTEEKAVTKGKKEKKVVDPNKPK